jgi:hypothetical protein
MNMQYKEKNRYFLSGKIVDYQEKNENHGIYSMILTTGSVIQIHFIDNRYSKELTHAQNANLKKGSLIYVKATMKDNILYCDQFIFQGQMKFSNLSKGEETNLFVGKITRINYLNKNILCMQMPVSIPGGNTKWMNLLYKGKYKDLFYETLRPKEVDGKIQYRTAEFVCQKEFLYHGFHQACLLDTYE